MNNTPAGIIKYCLDRADQAQQHDQLATADALREVAVHAEALLEREAPSSTGLVGEPLVLLYQDPDRVPCCPVCAELHQHASDDLNGRYSCTCSEETYLLDEWLFWVASHTICQHCGVSPSGDPDGLYCCTGDSKGQHDNYCAGADTPVQPAEWLRRNHRDFHEAGTHPSKPEDLIRNSYGDEGVFQGLARLQQQLDQLKLDQQHGYDHLASTQAADFAAVMEKLDCDPILFAGPRKSYREQPDPAEELPLVGCLLPYYDLVLFEGQHGDWNVRCCLGADEMLRNHLGRLHFPDKQSALTAIKAMEAEATEYPEDLC